mgnify:CR=1 FL=1
MNAPAVEVSSLTVKYGHIRALDGLSASFAPGSITGLLGRNGSGKSTLLATIAGFRRPNAGNALVDGKSAFEADDVMAQLCLIREGGDVLTSSSVRDNLRLARTLRTGWDGALAERLVGAFGLPLRKTVDALSRGQRSALSAIIGLATRTPLTIFDEVYLGMDAPSRQLFYDELLAEQIRSPRTVIISSHFLEEAEPLLENVVILHQGRLLLQGGLDELGDMGARVIGPSERVREFTDGRRILSEQELGGVLARSVYGEITMEDRERAAAGGLQLERLRVQDLYTGLTGDAQVRA